MTTIIRNKDVIIANPQLKPIYTPFVAEPGLLAAWRFGDGMDDLSNNANTLTPIGGNDSNLLIVFYVQIMPDDLVMQLHRF
ncbi:hypothetical protein P848_02401 [Klebsiella aerogenes UCI 45]|nr:hypothetical protein P848_02401 [Klebsiella aerogenes UCI 45]